MNYTPPIGFFSLVVMLFMGYGMAWADVEKWNFSDWETGDIIADKTVGSLTVKAKDGKNNDAYNQHLTVFELQSSKTIDGVKYTKRLLTNGAGSSDYRSLKIDVTGDCVITIVIASGSSQENRTLDLCEGRWNKSAPTKQFSLDGNGTTITYKYIGPTTSIYLGSDGGNMLFYYISVDDLKPVAEASTQWDFTKEYSADLANMGADANWVYTDENKRYDCSLTSTSPIPAFANGAAVESMRGLLFSITSGSEKSLRYNEKKSIGLIGAGVTMTIPKLRAGDVVTVVASSNSSKSPTRNILLSNADVEKLTFTTNSFTASDSKQSFTVANDGDVTLKVESSGVLFQSIEITHAKEMYPLSDVNDYNIVAKQNIDLTLFRTFPANKWATLVLPFALSKEQLESAFGEDAKVAEFVGAEGEGSDLNLKFMTVKSLKANVPVVILPTKNVSSLTFQGVNIVEGEPVKEVDGVKFVGTYKEIDAADVDDKEKKYFAASADALTFYSMQYMTTMKSFRAYIDTSAPELVSYTRLRMVFSDNDVATGVDNIDTTKHPVAMYNLAGQRVSPSLTGKTAKGLKGIVIVNGKKVMNR